MNKIKLLYDVIKTMKDKTNFKGVLTARLQKEQEIIFSLQNEFDKNLLTGQTRSKIFTEVNYADKKIKHEGITEFSASDSCESMPVRFMRHMHHHHAGKCCGIKAKLTKLAFAFAVLNNLQIKEQDQATIVSLNMNELPEDMKALIHEKMNSAASCHCHEHHGFAKEFLNIDQWDFTLNMIVNKQFEVEKIAITLDGAQINEQNKQSAINTSVEIQFAW